MMSATMWFSVPLHSAGSFCSHSAGCSRKTLAYRRSLHINIRYSALTIANAPFIIRAVILEMILSFFFLSHFDDEASFRLVMRVDYLPR
jgi:hypothetical protein